MVPKAVTTCMFATSDRAVQQMFTDVSEEATPFADYLLLARLIRRIWRWRQHAPPKALWTSTGLTGVTSQKTVLFHYHVAYIQKSSVRILAPCFTSHYLYPKYCFEKKVINLFILTETKVSLCLQAMKVKRSVTALVGSERSNSWSDHSHPGENLAVEDTRRAAGPVTKRTNIKLLKRNPTGPDLHDIKVDFRRYRTGCMPQEMPAALGYRYVVQSAKSWARQAEWWSWWPNFAWQVALGDLIFRRNIHLGRKYSWLMDLGN
jgi:hypothetical protein